MKIFLLLTFMVVNCCSFMLHGTSYEQFNKWNATLNGSLKFEFKTSQPNGLILYTDDGGTYDFFEIKLVEGALRLRYNLGAGAQIITIGRELNDGNWHNVTIKREGERTILNLDNMSHYSVSKGKEFVFGNIITNSNVYVGGMPSWYNSKLTKLALPSVIFEPRFIGQVRNLIYADVGQNLVRRQRVKRTLDTKNMQSDINSYNAASKNSIGVDVCEAEDPCKNNGVCITTDMGPVCDCQSSDYEGTFCERERAPSEASFKGSDYIFYDLNAKTNEGIITIQDTISFYFRTDKEDGLIFHSGNGMDYMNIMLKEGGIWVLIKVSSGKLDIQIKPNKVRFDDFRWHKVVLHRKVKEISTEISFCRVSLTVDDVYTDHSNTAGPFSALAITQLYIGGSENTRDLPGSNIGQNFVGCLRKMIYEIDNTKLDVIESAKKTNQLVSVKGDVVFKCADTASNAISFKTPDSYLVLPDWEAPRAGKFAIRFRTSEPNGLLVYSRASRESYSDLFAIELIEGDVYVLMDLGAGGVKQKVGVGKKNDLAWHTISVEKNDINAKVRVDSIGLDFAIPGGSRQLDLGSGLYVGGVPWNNFSLDSFPPSLWAGTLKRGFVGCMADVVMNDDRINLVDYALKEDSVAVEPVCRLPIEKCTSNPCKNDGMCVEGWNRFICDCSRTEFTGPTCSKPTPTLHFNGSQGVLLTMPQGTKHQAQDLVMRFKTHRPTCILLATTDKSQDRLEIAVFGGKIRVVIQMDGREKVLVNADSLNDNNWHRVHFSRFGSLIQLQVDNRRPITENLFQNETNLRMHHIHVGGYVPVEEELHPASMRMSKFIGAMQQVVYNDYNLFEAAKMANLHSGDDSIPQVQITATYTKDENTLNLQDAFTFLSKNTFIGLSSLQMHSPLSIYFQFKTKENNGLFLYNAGKDGDYIAIQLINGHVHLFMQCDNDLLKVKDAGRGSFSDNRWHSVSVNQPVQKIYTLFVDDIAVAVTRVKNPERVLRLNSLLYVGGVSQEVKGNLPKELLYKNGFQGCLANMHLNGEVPHLLRDAQASSSLVVSGCEGGTKKCSHNTCDNRGTCIPQWNTQICDCTMTSYSGPTCSQESTAYEFGPGKGLITYTFPEDRRPEMKADVLAFGFVTGKDDAVLFRVDSATSNDYIEIEIVEGNIFVVYNMGSQDQPIGEISTKVNDNQYHVVRFTRSGVNATLQLDDNKIQTSYPTGYQLTTFNAQSAIQIGGKWNKSKQRIERPFSGIIAGVSFNGLRILDLAYERDRRTEIRGDATKITDIKNQIKEPTLQIRMVPTEVVSKINNKKEGDDLIYSGDGPPCDPDDEDRCRNSIQNQREDDLVTAVYFPTERTLTSTRSSSSTRPETDFNTKPCDDEEDCVPQGSGASELPSQEYSSSPTTTDDEFISRVRTMNTTSTVSYNEELINKNITSSTHSPLTPNTSNITNIPIVTVVSVSILPTTDNETFLSKFPHHFDKALKKMGKNVKKVMMKHLSTTTTPSTTSTTTTTTTETTTSSTEFIMPSTRRPFPPPGYYPSDLFPLPPKDINPNVSKNNVDTASTSTAIIVIIICAILIIVIVVVIAVLLVNKKNENNYKTDPSKIYEQTSVLIPSNANQQCINRQLNNTKLINNKIKKRQDVKEWKITRAAKAFDENSS